MKIFKGKTKEDVQKKAAEALNELLGENRPILFLLSGGSSLSLLDYITIQRLENRVTIGMLDERYSISPTVNNFSRLTTLEFYKEAARAGVQFLETNVRETESLELFTERFERGITEWRDAHADGAVVITQGIGVDGHTCGIMAYPEKKEFFESLFDDINQMVAGYDTQGKGEFPVRVTVTLPFLRENVDHSVVYMVGEDKRQALDRVLADEGTLHETPGRIIHKMKDVQVFTDIDG